VVTTCRGHEKQRRKDSVQRVQSFNYAGRISFSDCCLAWWLQLITMNSFPKLFPLVFPTMQKTTFYVSYDPPKPSSLVTLVTLVGNILLDKLFILSSYMKIRGNQMGRIKCDLLKYFYDIILKINHISHLYIRDYITNFVKNCQFCIGQAGPPQKMDLFWEINGWSLLHRAPSIVCRKPWPICVEVLQKYLVNEILSCDLMAHCTGYSLKQYSSDTKARTWFDVYIGARCSIYYILTATKLTFLKTSFQSQNQINRAGFIKSMKQKMPEEGLYPAKQRSFRSYDTRHQWVDMFNRTWNIRLLFF
jgi:hypothetical protein